MVINIVMEQYGLSFVSQTSTIKMQKLYMVDRNKNSPKRFSNIDETRETT